MSDEYSIYEFPITNDLKNTVGLLHGGAIAMIIEEAIRSHLNKNIMVHSLSLRYLSAIKDKKGYVRLNKDEPTIKKSFNEDISVSGEMFCSKGKISVQFDCYIIDVNTFIRHQFSS